MVRAPGGVGWRELVRRVWDGIREHQIHGRAGELAYFFFLALFPLLVFVLSLVGWVMGPESGLQTAIVNWLSGFMPSSASGIVKPVVSETVSASGGGKALLGLAAALWSASTGMGAVLRTLDVVYEVPRRRSFLKRRVVSVALTIACGALMVVAVAAIVFGGRIARAIGSAVGARSGIVLAWEIVQWPLALVFVASGFALIYKRAPNREQRWRWVSPGAVLAVAIWLGASVGLRLFVTYIGNFSATYGSLAAVIVLLLWFYVTGLALLVGAEMNAAVERARKPRPAEPPRLIVPARAA